MERSRRQAELPQRRTGFAPLRAAMRSVLRPVVEVVAAWRERAGGRRLLSEMSDYQLKDIGFTRYDARFECKKPFWRR